MLLLLCAFVKLLCRGAKDSPLCEPASFRIVLAIVCMGAILCAGTRIRCVRAVFHVSNV